MKVSIFIPVYNEEKILENNLKRICKEMKKLNYSFEIYIVDDNSSDNTQKIGERLSKEEKEVNYLRYDVGPSQRENLAKSFNLAKGKIILFMDCDLSTNLEHLKELIYWIEEGYDISIGSRHLKESKVTRSISRNLVSNFWKYFLKRYFNSKINDHQCGFKAFKKDTLLELVKEMNHDSKFKRKFFWDSELLIRAQHKNLKIKEFPIEWTAGKKSTFKWGHGIESLVYPLKLKKKLILSSQL